MVNRSSKNRKAALNLGPPLHPKRTKARASSAGIRYAFRLFGLTDVDLKKLFDAGEKNNKTALLRVHMLHIVGVSYDSGKRAGRRAAMRREVAPVIAQQLDAHAKIEKELRRELIRYEKVDRELLQIGKNTVSVFDPMALIRPQKGNTK